MVDIRLAVGEIDSWFLTLDNFGHGFAGDVEALDVEVVGGQDELKQRSRGPPGKEGLGCDRRPLQATDLEEICVPGCPRMSVLFSLFS